jgi:HK97 family phage prohead protease
MAKRKKGEIERRYLPLDGVEIRAASDGETGATLVGYAAVYNVLSEDFGDFREIIAPGAFDGAVGGDVRALFNHDQNYVLGRTKSKTLRLRTDKRGLAVEIDPPDANWARDLVASVARGDVDQMSFGFRTVDEAWEETDGRIVRTIKKVELFDVSLVTYPAYPQTDVAVRSFNDWKTETAAPPDYGIKRKRLDLLAG